MSEEEKKAIEYLKNRLEILHNNTQWATEKSIKIVLNLIEKQQKELDFYKKEELGYIAGYEDGKRHKQTAVAIKNENAQQELFQKEIARLKEIIEQQQKEIEERNKYNTTTLPFEKIKADEENNEKSDPL